MNKTIFILGCGIMQMPALQIASEMGWKVVGADRNPNALGRKFCNQFFPIDLRNIDSLIEAAKQVKEHGSLDGVFTTGTDFSVAVASMAKEFNLPGHSVEAAWNATDKLLMRKKLTEHNIPNPKFSAVGPNDNLETCVQSVPAPWVVKPVDSMAARGVIKVSNFDNLRWAVKHAIKISWSSRAIVESCINGPEFSLDALIENGKIIRCGLADRHICFPPYFVEIGHTIPSAFPEDAADAIWDVFEQSIRALGLSHGAAKGDIRLSPEGPMVGEVAGRLSGGYMSGWTWPLASGIQTNRGGLRLAVGMNSGLGKKTVKNMVSAERALIGIEGRIAALQGKDAALAIPGVKHVFIRFGKNSRSSFPINNMEKLANVISVALTYQEAEQIAIKALRELKLVLDKNCEETGFYLESNQAFPPSEFDINHKAPKTLKESIKTIWNNFPPHPARRYHNGSMLLLPKEIFHHNNFCDSLGRSINQIISILEEENLCKYRLYSETPCHNSLEIPQPGRKESDFLKAIIKGGLPGARWFMERQN